MKKMMKKEYQAPEIELICIKTGEDVLSASDEIEGSNPIDREYGIVFPY